MTFETIKVRDQVLGLKLDVGDVRFFFGSAALSAVDLVRLYPEYEYAWLNQVHGRAVVEADPKVRPEADAHFTRRAVRAPVIRTADCVPILLASASTVCAVHAGWRGVAANIIAETRAVFAGEEVLVAAIGPHIGPQSFEIGADVELELRRAGGVAVPDGHKYRFDLGSLVRAQIAASFGAGVPVHSTGVDTMTDRHFHSHRRDAASAGRNLSFVVLNA